MPRWAGVALGEGSLPAKGTTAHRRLKQRLLERAAPSGRCLIWQGFRDPKGYGTVSHGCRPWRAHRLMFVLCRGEIPAGMVVRHRCDQPGCINPHHLLLGTHADNVADRVKRQRNGNNKGERHGRSKLTDQQVVLIRTLLTQPRPPSHRELGRRFGISYQLVGNIHRRERWAHL